MKEQAESFHLNGHIIGFRPQTQKLESPYKTLSNTLAVKGLRRSFRWCQRIFPNMCMSKVEKNLEKGLFTNEGLMKQPVGLACFN